MAFPNYGEAQRAANEIISDFRITSPVVPVFDIAEQKGYKIEFFKPDGELKEVSGFTDLKSKTIFINEEDPLYRQSFTVAHELGHIILGHKSNEFGVLLRNTHIPTTPIEKEANSFAANLLMPEALLRKTMSQYNLDERHVEILAGIFGVSPEAMRIRLENFNKHRSFSLS